MSMIISNILVGTNVSIMWILFIGLVILPMKKNESAVKHVDCGKRVHHKKRVNRRYDSVLNFNDISEFTEKENVTKLYNSCISEISKEEREMVNYALNNCTSVASKEGAMLNALINSNLLVKRHGRLKKTGILIDVLPRSNVVNSLRAV